MGATGSVVGTGLLVGGLPMGAPMLVEVELVVGCAAAAARSGAELGVEPQAARIAAAPIIATVPANVRRTRVRVTK